MLHLNNRTNTHMYGCNIRKGFVCKKIREDQAIALTNLFLSLFVRAILGHTEYWLLPFVADHSYLQIQSPT